jgi:class 3 adenylate cyclase/tetratricopeptide (TPR) repeat protein
MNCGNKLSRACTNCGTSLPGNARFCSNCGQPVAVSTPVDETRLNKLAAAAPQPLAEKMRAAETNSERKIVTILFADVVGSTSLAEKMDPEEWTAIMNRAFERISPMIYKYEGTIARLMGDAVLAFFGAPVAHEDDPIRAIHAAQDMLTAANDYAREVKRTHAIDFQIRIGLNTGMVVVGAVGSDLKYEYTAMGDAVNLAARMQSAADPGTTLIAENTYRGAAAFFEFEDRGKLSVKGKAEPVQVYRVIGERAGVVSGRGIEGLSSPLIGRDADMRTLNHAIDEVRRGRGQIISVIAEAGLGKSRLVTELLRPHKIDLRIWEGRSLSYETAEPYAPFIDMFTTVIGLSSLPGDSEKYAAIKTWIANTLPQPADNLAPLIASLLEIKPAVEDEPLVRFLEPAQLHGRIYQAVQQLIEQLAAQQALVLVFEDLHWTDQTSLDLIEQLLPICDRAMLLILALFRPRRDESSWKFHEVAARDHGHRYTQIQLQPLDNDQARELVANLLQIEDLPAKVRSLILAKAEGNPFFVEEVIRSLLDAKLVVRIEDHWRATREIENIAVPDSLVGVISSRLDNLDEESKRTAQTASVIGREFEFNIMADVQKPAPKLNESLSMLQRRELIHEKSRLPARAFMFKHVLTQETAYGMMLMSQRREMHRRVAECLEQLSPDRVGEIARHFVAAQAKDRALPYLIEAADRAAHAYSNPEAIGYYTQALEIIKTIDQPTYARKAFEGLGGIKMSTGDMPGAAEIYQAMQQFAESSNDIPMQVSAHNKLAGVLMFMGQMPPAEQHLLQSEALAREYEDKFGLAEMFTVRCGVCNMMGDFDGVARYMGESIRIGQELNVKEQMAFGLTHRSIALTNMTHFSEAWPVVQEGLQLAETIGHLRFRAEILGYPVVFHHLLNGDPDSARQAAEEAARIAAKIGTAVAECIATIMLGMMAQERGEYERAIEFFQRAQQVGRSTGIPFMEAYGIGGLAATYLDISPKLTDKIGEYHQQAAGMLQTPMGMPAGGISWIDLGYCLLEMDDVDHAHELFTLGLNMPTQQGVINRPRFMVGLAYIAIERGDLVEAQRQASAARTYMQERQMENLFEAEVSLVEGRISDAQGDRETALSKFYEAESISKKLGLRPFIWEAQAGAAKVLAVLGRSSEAETKRAEALAMIDQIAGLFKNEEWRKLYIENARSKV